MNKLLLLFCLFIINGFAFSQNNEIIEWQKNNPNVIFIEKNDASIDLIEKLESKGMKYIIFDNEVKESDILAFTNSSSLKKGYYQLDGFNVRNEEAQFVKEWFASHTEIKVFTKSAISAFSTDQIEYYKSIDALILEGELITMQDLKTTTMSTKYKSILLFFAICLQSTYFGQTNTPCGAPVLTPGASCTNTAGTTVGATFQSNAANGGTPSCASPGAPDVWYQFVAPAGGAVNIQMTAGTMTDSGLGLYNGPCGSPTEISCDDDSGAGTMSQINATGLTPGVTYFIRIWQFSSGTGTFSICLQTPPPPPTNVNCSIPNPICSGSPVNFTAQANGTAASTVNPGNNYGCLFTSPNPSWYYLQIATGGNLVIDITAGADVDYAIWGPFPNLANAVANCNSYGVPTDCSYSPSPTEQVNIPVLAGQTYVLLVTNFAAVVQTIDINDAVANTAVTDCSIVPLSINLSSFSATRTNGLVELSWVTMSESNNDYFIVERSYDGESWSVVDYVDGAGNSSSPKLYNLEDRNAKNTKVYYRIKQFDFDGKSTTSSSIVVSDYLENIMSIYPNPAKNQLNVIAPFEFNQIELIDIQGEVIKTISVESTLQSFVDLSEMKDGMYFIKVTDGVKLSNQRFVINK